MKVGIAQYIRFKEVSGGYLPSRNYQNFFVEDSRTFNSVIYEFAPYRISGAISIKGGDSIQASITTIPNDLTVGLATESVTSGWVVEINTVYVNAVAAVVSGSTPLVGTAEGAFEEGGLLSTEFWNCSSMSQDYEKVTITLSNPLDATRKQVPKRVLSTNLVGSLPPTGSIFAS